jgi:hypothetical protein
VYVRFALDFPNMRTYPNNFSVRLSGILPDGDSGILPHRLRKKTFSHEAVPSGTLLARYYPAQLRVVTQSLYMDTQVHRLFIALSI